MRRLQTGPQRHGPRLAQVVGLRPPLPRRSVSVSSVAGVGYNPFAGKTFVITGTLVKRSKADAEISIEARGGKVAGAPSRKTDYLLAGEKAGAKLDKARALGVRVLSEADFDLMIQQAGPITKEQRDAYLG